MSKQKKFKHLNKILIPCLSVVSASAIVIPMSIMTTKHHVSIRFDQEDVSFTGDLYVYNFYLNKKLETGQSIFVTTEKSDWYLLDCWLEPVNNDPIVPEDTLFNVVMSFKSPKPEVTKGMGAINVYFTCVDSNNDVVWKDSIQCLRFNKTR